MSMAVRLGIPASFRRFSGAAADLGAPILVSANAFRRRNGGGFTSPSADLFNGCDVALDSAGFVAMLLYRGYPWTVRQYVALAGAHPWAWWAAMDFCCEREVAGDQQQIDERVRRTVTQLLSCRVAAEEAGIAGPMPVLQGWRPADYLRCAEMMGDLPVLVGVGSVCRRHLGGPDGLLTIMAALDRALPPSVRLHLFGVKGSAISELAGHPRVFSVDSMAWDQAARREKGDQSCTVDYRIGHMRRWYTTNRSLLQPAQHRLAV